MWTATCWKGPCGNTTGCRSAGEVTTVLPHNWQVGHDDRTVWSSSSMHCFVRTTPWWPSWGRCTICSCEDNGTTRRVLQKIRGDSVASSCLTHQVVKLDISRKRLFRSQPFRVNDLSKLCELRTVFTLSIKVCQRQCHQEGRNVSYFTEVQLRISSCTCAEGNTCSSILRCFGSGADEGTVKQCACGKSLSFSPCLATAAEKEKLQESLQRQLQMGSQYLKHYLCSLSCLLICWWVWQSFFLSIRLAVLCSG